MQQPCLKIIAGCNGAGKSTYSKLFSEDTVPFDYDKRFLERYRSMPDSELREQIAINKTSISSNIAILLYTPWLDLPNWK